MKVVVPHTRALPLLHALAASVAALMPLTSQADTLFSRPSDINVLGAPNTDGNGTVSEASDHELRSGRDSNGVYSSSVLVFQLPNLGATAAPFANAAFSVNIDYSGSVDAFNAGLNRDLYGLGARATDEVLGSDFYHGALDTTDSILLQGGFINSGNTPRFSGGFRQSTDAVGSLTLTDYLNAQYANGAGVGQYVFLRISVNQTNDNLDSIYFSPGESGNPASIDFTEAVVPEPATYLAGFGGLAVVFLKLRRRRAVHRRLVCA